jgi:hypothetical protein
VCASEGKVLHDLHQRRVGALECGSLLSGVVAHRPQALPGCQALPVARVSGRTGTCSTTRKRVAAQELRSYDDPRAQSTCQAGLLHGLLQYLLHLLGQRACGLRC